MSFTKRCINCFFVMHKQIIETNNTFSYANYTLCVSIDLWSSKIISLWSIYIFQTLRSGPLVSTLRPIFLSFCIFYIYFDPPGGNTISWSIFSKIDFNNVDMKYLFFTNVQHVFIMKSFSVMSFQPIKLFRLTGHNNTNCIDDE